jgi:MarR family transcriptional regulator for hemolysin
MGVASLGKHSAALMDTLDRVEFGYAVTDITRLLRRVFDRRSLHLGLTRAQWRAMHRIQRVPGLSQTQLSEDLDLEPIAIGRVVDRLERAGFVERRPDPADRRRWNLYPLPKSADVMVGMRRVAEQLHDELLEGVDRAELHATMQVLARVKDTLDILDQERRPPARAKKRARAPRTPL